MKTDIVCLSKNTTKQPYAAFTDQVIGIKKEGQFIILEPGDLKQLEKVVGGGNLKSNITEYLMTHK